MILFTLLGGVTRKRSLGAPCEPVVNSRLFLMGGGLNHTKIIYKIY